MPDLYPYNYWVLYAAIALLILTVILTVVKILGEVKKMMEIMPKVEKIQRNVTLAQIKMEVMNEKKAADAKKNKIFVIAIPILLAIYNTYKKDETAHGPKGYVKAAKQVLSERTEEKKFIKKVASAIH